MHHPWEAAEAERCAPDPHHPSSWIAHLEEAVVQVVHPRQEAAVAAPAADPYPLEAAEAHLAHEFALPVLAAKARLADAFQPWAEMPSAGLALPSLKAVVEAAERPYPAAEAEAFRCLAAVAAHPP